MSQYNDQCAAIRSALKDAEFTGVNVNTVVSSQGGEWDYIIFSLVRSLPDYRIEKCPTLGWCSQNLGFITDKHQINVALTRAKKGLFLIGNKHLLKCDEVWKDLIQTYDRKGCVVNGSISCRIVPWGKDRIWRLLTSIYHSTVKEELNGNEDIEKKLVASQYKVLKASGTRCKDLDALLQASTHISASQNSTEDTYG
ncbi:unnamed protein product [Mytilus coruscus]|uniref:DNA2/NAM7 helicase-like C-terminal domain-containing protein n=1 Tax=Mytilus coruscus TaxID=42192 RepID=A0A6J8ARF6_MYTCO|nr:unnamed protein product [Mytilus coruscus]